MERQLPPCILFPALECWRWIYCLGDLLINKSFQRSNTCWQRFELSFSCFFFFNNSCYFMIIVVKYQRALMISAFTLYIKLHDKQKWSLQLAAHSFLHKYLCIDFFFSLPSIRMLMWRIIFVSTCAPVRVYVCVCVHVCLGTRVSGGMCHSANCPYS